MRSVRPRKLDCWQQASVQWKQVHKAKMGDVTRANRALQLAQVGELSAARQALEGVELVPGTLPPLPRRPIPEDLIDPQPRVLLNFCEDTFATNLRSARRGAAGGPSGMMAKHLRILLDCERASHAFYEADVPRSSGRIATWSTDGAEETQWWMRLHFERDHVVRCATSTEGVKSCRS